MGLPLTTTPFPNVLVDGKPIGFVKRMTTDMSSATQTMSLILELDLTSFVPELRGETVDILSPMGLASSRESEASELDRCFMKMHGYLSAVAEVLELDGPVHLEIDRNEAACFTNISVVFYFRDPYGDTVEGRVGHDWSDEVIEAIAHGTGYERWWQDTARTMAQEMSEYVENYSNGQREEDVVDALVTDKDMSVDDDDIPF